MSTHLFVYGTLMLGESRHRHMAGQKLIGAARTRPEYRLYDAGDYPVLVTAARGRSIAGEVWLVDDEALLALDQVEEVDEGLYSRRTIGLQAPFDTVAVVGYIYLQSVDGLPEIERSWRERQQK